jgi:hypothetical protein
VLAKFVSVGCHEKLVVFGTQLLHRDCSDSGFPLQCMDAKAGKTPELPMGTNAHHRDGTGQTDRISG